VTGTAVGDEGVAPTAKRRGVASTQAPTESFRLRTDTFSGVVEVTVLVDYAKKFGEKWEMANNVRRLWRRCMHQATRASPDDKDYPN
jgi:hypothetical protein